MITPHNFDQQYVFKGKVKAWSLAMIAVGIIGIIYGFASGGGERTFANLLLMAYYFAGVCIFAVCFCAMQYVAQAGWSASIVRIPHVFAKMLPIVAVILLAVISAGIFFTHTSLNEEGKEAVLPYLYKVWSAHGVTSPGNEHYDAIIAGKSTFLNIPFFFIRLFSYLTAYSFMGWLFVKYSTNEDQVGGLANHRKSFKLACIFLVVVGFTIPLFAFDAVMSLEAHWFSTLFGWYNFIGFFVTGTVAITLTVIYLYETGYLKWVNESHLQTLGIQVFGFSIFWAYLWFEQFLLIYYSNIPEESVYFYKRLEPQFNIWFWLNMVINFIVPVFALMTRDAKRKIKTLKITCVILVLGHWLDYWIMVIPGTSGAQSQHWYSEIGVIEVSTFLGFVGFFIYLTLNTLSKFKALAPKNHPMLQESLQHHAG
jgi:hypothetical protein